MANNTIEPSHMTSMFKEEQMDQLFMILSANVVRSRSVLTVVYIRVYDRYEETDSDFYLELTNLLENEVRKTDIMFQTPRHLEWGVLLFQSGEKEAVAFINRLKQKMEVSLLFCLTEVRSDHRSFDQLQEESSQMLEYAKQQGPWSIKVVSSFQKPTKEKIIISIIEPDPIFKKVLYRTISALKDSRFDLEIQSYQDGFEYLDARIYQTSYTQIVIMNDILPRKNGLEILTTLRDIPNSQKIKIFMMTKRTSEQEMVYAYQKGVNRYLIKPFNLQLFEAQLKRTLEDLWL
ncbi:response regulator [Gracilibacillus massiliensis]|uniref:response regulator n=1 Tax=Gracilibacillus massiliensis TaxID=1564956 RepID=UPI00071E3AAE|nr:response regulator [Gracilibacillus massiliensis]